MAILESIQPKAKQEQISSFYHSLAEEKSTFQLPLEAIFQSETLYVVWDTSENILAMAGLRKKCCCSVFFVVVKKEFQGQGWGKQLTEKCFEALSLWNPIFLTVERDNKKAQSLYESLGMHVVSVDHKRVIMVKAKGPLNWFMQFYPFWPKLHRD